MGSSSCGVIASEMVMVDMDCHISAVWRRHAIASVMVMVDMDCQIAAVCGRHVQNDFKCDGDG